jgi:cytochrome P450
LETYGTIVRIWLGPRLTIIVSSPEDARMVLNNPKVVDRDHLVCAFLDSLIDSSLLTAKGDVVRARRKLMMPAFHIKNLTEYLDVFTRKGEELCEQLDKMADGRNVDIKDQLAICLLDALYETFFGEFDFAYTIVCKVNRFIV